MKKEYSLVKIDKTMICNKNLGLEKMETIRNKIKVVIVASSKKSWYNKYNKNFN